jgi:signal transduction histidine kinase
MLLSAAAGKCILARTLAGRLLLAFATAGLYLGLVASYRANPSSAPCLIAAVTTLALAVFVLSRNVRSRLNRAFFYFALALASYVTLVYLLHMATVWGIGRVTPAVRLLRNGNLLLPPTLMYLGYRFVEKRSRALLVLTWLSLATVLPFLVLNLMGRYVTSYRLAGPTYVPADALGLYAACFAVTGLWLLTWWAVFLVKTFAAHGRQRRNQYFLFFAAISVILFPGLIGFLPAFRDMSFPVVFGLAFVAFPLILTIAVLRYSLFDIKIAVRRTLPYALGTALIGGAYSLAMWGLSAAGARVGIIPRGSEWIVLLLLMGIGFRPTLEALQAGLDRLLFRTEAKLDAVLASAAGRYTAAVSADALAAEVAGDARSALGLEGAAVLLGDGAASRVVHAGDPGSLTQLAGRETPPVLQSDAVVLAEDDGTLALGQGGSCSASTAEILRSAEAAAAVAFGTAESRALLICRQKRSLLSLNSRDVAFIRSLAAQAGMAMSSLASAKDASEAREITAAVFDSMTNPVSLVDDGGVVSVGNPAFDAAFPQSRGRRLQEVGLGRLARLEGSFGPEEIETSRGTFVASARRLDLPGRTPRHLLVLTDVTELRRLQESARRREALVEIGRAVSSVNHEVMNLLSPVTYYLDKARGLSRDERVVEAIDVASKRIAALDALGKDLRDCYREPQLMLRNVPLSDALDATLPDLAVTAGATWTPPVVTGSQLQVRADPQRLRQVILNLLRNAWEAMEGLPEKIWSVTAVRRGNTVGIEIRDGGRGMPPEQLARLFEPFFTTRKGRGSGLGLTVARRFAEAHGAELRFESAVGRGTTACLVWPCASEPSPPRGEPAATAGAAAASG